MGVERRDDEYTFVISIRKEKFELVSQKFPTEAQIVFQSLGLEVTWTGRPRYLFLALRKGTVNSVGNTIILVSGHKVLAFSYRLEYESGGQATCFAMNSDGFVKAGMLDFSQMLLIQLVSAVWCCSRGTRSKTALRAGASSGLESIKSTSCVPVVIG